MIDVDKMRGSLFKELKQAVEVLATDDRPPNPPPLFLAIKNRPTVAYYEIILWFHLFFSPDNEWERNVLDDIKKALVGLPAMVMGEKARALARKIGDCIIHSVNRAATAFEYFMRWVIRPYKLYHHDKVVEVDMVRLRELLNLHWMANGDFFNAFKRFLIYERACQREGRFTDHFTIYLMEACNYLTSGPADAHQRQIMFACYLDRIPQELWAVALGPSKAKLGDALHSLAHNGPSPSALVDNWYSQVSTEALPLLVHTERGARNLVETLTPGLVVQPLPEGEAEAHMLEVRMNLNAKGGRIDGGYLHILKHRPDDLFTLQNLTPAWPHHEQIYTAKGFNWAERKRILDGRDIVLENMRQNLLLEDATRKRKREEAGGV